MHLFHSLHGLILCLECPTHKRIFISVVVKFFLSLLCFLLFTVFTSTVAQTETVYPVQIKPGNKLVKQIYNFINTQTTIISQMLILLCTEIKCETFFDVCFIKFFFFCFPKVDF